MPKCRPPTTWHYVRLPHLPVSRDGPVLMLIWFSLVHGRLNCVRVLNIDTAAAQRQGEYIFQLRRPISMSKPWRNHHNTSFFLFAFHEVLRPIFLSKRNSIKCRCPDRHNGAEFQPKIFLPFDSFSRLVSLSRFSNKQCRDFFNFPPKKKKKNSQECLVVKLLVGYH